MSNNHIFQNLRPDVDYQIQVLARNGNGTSLPSPTVTARTLQGKLSSHYPDRYFAWFPLLSTLGRRFCWTRKRLHFCFWSVILLLFVWRNIASPALQRVKLAFKGLFKVTVKSHLWIDCISLILLADISILKSAGDKNGDFSTGIKSSE